MNNSRKYRSLFWPMVLIGVGVVWLLANLGALRPASVGALVSFWPLILVFIGLDVLFGRRSPVVGATIGVLAIASVVGILIFAPALNLPAAASGTLQTKDISEPVGGATAANVNLDFSSQPVDVHTVSSPANLMEAHIEYYGGLSYSSNGNPTRQISLSPSSNVTFFLGWDNNAIWDIGLNPSVATALRINGASGSTTLDLAGLNLTSFTYDQGSGSAEVTLPAVAGGYTADFRGASGSLNLVLPENGSLALQIDGGSGSINISLPAGAAVRFEVLNSGSGSVHVPEGFEQVSSAAKSKQGVWQTPSYDTAANQIDIICNSLGSGSLTLR